MSVVGTGVERVLTSGGCGNDGHEAGTSQAVEYQTIPSHKRSLVLIFGLNIQIILETIGCVTKLTS